MGGFFKKKEKCKNPSNSHSFSRGYHFNGLACKLRHQNLLCSCLCASWTIFLGGKAGYSQEHSYSLKIVRIFWFPKGLWARLIIPVCCFVHSYFHWALQSHSLFLILGFDPRLGNQRISTYFSSICCIGWSGESSTCKWPPHYSCWWILQCLSREPIAWFSEVLLVGTTKFKYLEGTAATDTFEESYCDSLIPKKSLWLNFPTVPLIHSASEKFWTVFKVTFSGRRFFFFVTLIAEHKSWPLCQLPVS